MTGSGTLIDPYIISTATDLYNIRDNTDAYYQLGSNIDLSTYSDWTPIPTFTGGFDGNGYEISNMTISTIVTVSPACTGLFVNFGHDGADPIEIKNFTMKSCTINLENQNFANSRWIGILVGRVNPTNSYITISDIKFKDCAINIHNVSSAYLYYTGILTGEHGGVQTKRISCVDCNVSASSGSPNPDYVGVMFGKISGGVISESYVQDCDLVSLRGDSYNYTGGLVGNAALNTIINCYVLNTKIFNGQYNTSAISAGGICYAEGVTSTWYGPIMTYCYSVALNDPRNKENIVGIGLAGYGSSTNYYDVDVVGSNLGDSTPKHTLEMKTQSTFDGWDFDTIWGIDNKYNTGYPYLLNNPPKPEIIDPVIPEGEDDTNITNYDYIGLYIEDPTILPDSIMIVQLANTDLGEPSLDKKINYLEIDYLGGGDLYIYVDDLLLNKITLTYNTNKKIQRYYMSLQLRKVFNTLKIVIRSEDKDFIFYNAELDIDVYERIFG